MFYRLGKKTQKNLRGGWQPPSSPLYVRGLRNNSLVKGKNMRPAGLRRAVENEAWYQGSWCIIYFYSSLIGSLTVFFTFFFSSASYFSQYNSRLVRKLPGITTLPVPSQLENNNSKDQFLSSSETAIYEQQLLQEKLQAKVRELQEKLAMQNSGWDPKLPTIFAITPTYRRFLQKAELTRTAQTLKHVKNLHWIVVEDSHEKTNLVKRLLNHFGIRYTHLNVRTPVEMRIGRNKPRWTKSRGTEQRNVGLEWIRDNIKPNETKGVVYFADDDNTYDIRLFDEVTIFSSFISFCLLGIFIMFAQWKLFRVASPYQRESTTFLYSGFQILACPVSVRESWILDSSRW